MNFIKRLKIATGITKDTARKNQEDDNFHILETDSTDVIFAKKLIQNNGHFFYCDNQKKIIRTISALTKKINSNLIYCTEPVLQELLSKANITYNTDDYLACDTMFSSCEYLIAHQGKIMLSSHQLGPNDIKNLPKEHIVIAYTSQIVKNLNDAMSGVNTRHIDNLPSTITTITGSTSSNSKINEGNVKNLSVLLIEDFKKQNLT